MIRRIIKINEELCNGCGICADACHEGAIGMVDGKAVLTREDYCDGLGDCLPACPAGAITFEEREAPAYDEAAVKAAQAKKQGKDSKGILSRKATERATEKAVETAVEMAVEMADTEMADTATADTATETRTDTKSQLRQWPVQIKLVPVKAPYFENANLLVAADCAAYAYGNFHNDFIRNRITVIGCPKLDMVDYTEKLTEILRQNEIQSVTVVRMEVPCCGGIEMAARRAMEASGKRIPWQVVTVSTDGALL